MEVRDHGQQPFGRGRKVKATFAAVVAAASRGDSGCYLSTQRRQRGADGIPALMAEPLTSLAADFPVRPALLGTLVPEAVNLWMGHAPDGASSGQLLVPVSPPARVSSFVALVVNGTCRPWTCQSRVSSQACTTTSTTTCTRCCGAGSVCGCFRRGLLLACTRMVACGRCTRTGGSSTMGRCSSVRHQEWKLQSPASHLFTPR